MFAPRYFPVRYFAPRFWPPGVVVVLVSKAPAVGRKYKKIQVEDRTLWVKADPTLDEALVIEEYLEWLRRQSEEGVLQVDLEEAVKLDEESLRDLGQDLIVILLLAGEI